MVELADNLTLRQIWWCGLISPGESEVGWVVGLVLVCWSAVVGLETSITQLSGWQWVCWNVTNWSGGFSQELHTASFFSFLSSFAEICGGPEAVCSDKV